MRFGLGVPRSRRTSWVTAVSCPAVWPKILADVDQLTPLNIRIVSGEAYYGAQPGQALPTADGGGNQTPDPICDESFDSASECGELIDDLFDGGDDDFFGEFLAALYEENACADKFFLFS